MIALTLVVLLGCSPAAGISSSTAPTNSVPAATETETVIPATPSPTVEDSASRLPSPTTTLESRIGMHVSHTINATLDYDQKSAEIEQGITIDNLPVDIATMTLVVEPNRYPDGFALESLTVNNVPVQSYHLQVNQLSFDLPVRKMGEPVQIKLVYRIFLPVNLVQGDFYRTQAYGYTDRQVNLADWYAIVPPLDGQDQWIVHEPLVFGEALVNPVADFLVQLTIVDHQDLLVVAASSQAVRVENLYSFELEQARSFAISISPDYTVVEQQVGEITVRAYGFSDSQAANQAVLGWASQAVPLFTDLFGPLPRQVVSVVQADFLDGMEYDGLVFVSKGFYNLYDGSIHGYLSLITVHELAHQWFYALVGNDQATEPWLDEGLATFSELEFLENMYPNEASWWWAYRVNFYQPTGSIDLPVQKYTSYDQYRNAVYLRSAQFLSDLRELTGKVAFDKALRDYVQKNREKIATSAAFWQAFQSSPGYPFAELRSTYFTNLP